MVAFSIGVLLALTVVLCLAGAAGRVCERLFFRVVPEKKTASGSAKSKAGK